MTQLSSTADPARLAGFTEQIRANCPGLAIQSAEANFSGQFNDIIVVNGEWIFRFPRYAEGVRALGAEARLLEQLRGRLPLPIPEPRYASFDSPEPGRAFLGYRLLPGVPFFRDRLESIENEALRERLAGQLAGFLTALHDLPWAELGCTTVSDRREDWAALYAQVRENLFPAMRAAARQALAAHFAAYLDDAALHQFAPVLRHGDFGGSNILYDPAQAAVCGVIDFSFCAPGDAAFDLASISTLGEDLFQRIFKRYAADEGQRALLAARARFYRGTFALMEALDGLRLGDEGAYHSGMQAYI
jgi:aminoglycoside 2''-phosphotransferase